MNITPELFEQRVAVLIEKALPDLTFKDNGILKDTADIIIRYKIFDLAKEISALADQLVTEACQKFHKSIKTIRKVFYKDGGSCLLETNEGTFYFDYAIDSKHRGTWYKALFKQGKEEDKVKDPRLIKQLEDLRNEL